MTYPTGVKRPSKYVREYGKPLSELSEVLKVSRTTLIHWSQKGYDIFDKSKIFNLFRHERRLGVTWHNMLSRCGNPKDKKYEYYGGRGIKIKMTKLDLAILWERDKAYLLESPSIDRLNSNGHYELSNCRFIEMAENRTKNT